ncbi:MAG: type II toxin-antitoxin system HipA family toxin [Elusimicrobiota bacterium]|jgi:serine/threonine-protein kinase HipA|nr:type II toxin-antitoxin system HipA family toxin [Elusimicrobiota bacterium]
MDKKLSVRLFGEEAGILEQDKYGDMSFTYCDNAKTAISHSLPLEKKTFTQKECRPYFNGLLPENEYIRKKIAGMFGISANNDFSILKAIGHDCAGALSLHNLEEPVKNVDFIQLEGITQTEESLAKYIEQLPEKPFFMEMDNDIRLSLAGIQNKASITLIDNEVCLPKNNTPSTHILKPLMSKYKDTVLNEYICMSLASTMGINASNVEIRSANNIAYLLIERYDREVKDAKVKRIHQEDFCQALGILSINKYQADGGPGYKQCFELLNITQIPATDRLTLIKMLMFNYLIGNNDAHGKNFSLLYKNKKPILSPAYDLLSTESYPDLTKKMAMKIGSTYKKEWTNADNWKAFCEEIEYSFPAFKKEFLNMCEKLPHTLDETIKSLDITVERDIANLIKEAALKNIKQIEENLS